MSHTSYDSTTAWCNVKSTLIKSPLVYTFPADNQQILNLKKKHYSEAAISTGSTGLSLLLDSSTCNEHDIEWFIYKMLGTKFNAQYEIFR